MRRLLLENPDHRFESQTIEYDDGAVPNAELEVYEDQSRSILSENKSPDLGFRFSLNAYRGCLHGCSYCYARPSHEYLGFGAGSDFERKILIKPRAAQLLREVLSRRSWKRELVVVSANTDAYQPLEARYQLTRRCLEVFVEYANPIHVITKSPLVERDIELLCELKKTGKVGVSVSIPFWDPDVARAIEPYAATPARRIETIRRLSEAGLDVTVNVAPLIPGLGDREMAKVMEAARRAGAKRAAYMLLRLPGAVREVFERRLRRELPLQADRVMAMTRRARGGRDNDPRFFSRMRGEGQYAETLRALFARTAERLGLETHASEEPHPEAEAEPLPTKGQLSLFD